MNNGYDFKPMPKQYECQINHLENFVGIEACRPTEVFVAMYPHLQDDDKLNVLVFDFPSMLASLFDCPIFNKPENLVVNPNDHYGKYKTPDGRLVEVNSGRPTFFRRNPCRRVPRACVRESSHICLFRRNSTFRWWILANEALIVFGDMEFSMSPGKFPHLFWRMSFVRENNWENNRDKDREKWLPSGRNDSWPGG
jgi:hypothetical protein